MEKNIILLLRHEKKNCIKFERIIWFELGKKMWKIHRNV